MRLYLSGPITGIQNNNSHAFDAAAKRLREQGNFVINPAELSALFGSEEEIAKAFDYFYKLTNFDIPNWNEKLAESVMDADLAAVRSCDAIYMLRGWETSRGAKRELKEALEHGLTVMQEGGNCE